MFALDFVSESRDLFIVSQCLATSASKAAHTTIMLLPWSVVYGEQYYLPNYATGITFTIVAGISVALRFLTRFLSNIKFGIDDWLVLAAFTFFFVEEVLQLVCKSEARPVLLTVC